MLTKSIQSSTRIMILQRALFGLITDPGTICMWAFTLSIILFKYTATGYWYTGDDFVFHFSLMIGVVLIPSYFTLRKLFGKIMPTDRSPLPNNWKKEYIIPRIFAVITIWIILATALYGLGIYVFAVMPNVFEMQKTLEAEKIILAGTIYGTLYVPGMNFYWLCLINKKEISRKSLFYKKWRA